MNEMYPSIRQQGHAIEDYVFQAFNRHVVSTHQWPSPMINMVYEFVFAARNHPNEYDRNMNHWYVKKSLQAAEDWQELLDKKSQLELRELQEYLNLEFEGDDMGRPADDDLDYYGMEDDEDYLYQE